MNRTVTVLVAAMIGVAALAGCSSDDDPGSSDDASGDGEEFCGVLEGSAEAQDDLSTPEGLEAFEEFVAAAPDELDGPMQTIEETIDAVTGLDEDDPDAFGALFGAFLDPRFIAASAEIEDWGVDNCGLPEGFLDADSGSFDDGDVDDDLASGDALATADIRTYLDDTYGDRAPYADIIGLTRVNRAVIASFGVEATVEDALEVCEAIATYVYDLGEGGEGVDVSVADAEGETMATRVESSAECEAS
jgi:hypothetical protein